MRNPFKDDKDWNLRFWVWVLVLVGGPLIPLIGLSVYRHNAEEKMQQEYLADILGKCFKTDDGQTGRATWGFRRAGTISLDIGEKGFIYLRRNVDEVPCTPNGEARD